SSRSPDAANRPHAASPSAATAARSPSSTPLDGGAEIAGGRVVATIGFVTAIVDEGADELGTLRSSVDPTRRSEKTTAPPSNTTTAAATTRDSCIKERRPARPSPPPSGRASRRSAGGAESAPPSSRRQRWLPI